MPNHFHLVLWPSDGRQLSDFMHWLTATHSKRWHARHRSTGTGPVYQGRFKALPVQTDRYFFNVCRYVERNPVRARLVDRAESWRWSSLTNDCQNGNLVALHPWPIAKPSDWRDFVNCEEPVSELTAVRESIRASAPYGDPRWCDAVTVDLGCRPRV